MDPRAFVAGGLAAAACVQDRAERLGIVDLGS